MRGMPSNPVICTACGSEWGFPKDGLCVNCRNLKLRKYIWTPALDDELRRIYAGNARSRKELSAALRAFRVRLGWPVNALTSRAMCLRITRFEKHAWTPEHDALLRSIIGTKSIKFLGKKLGRSPQSIRCRLSIMGLSGRYADGYTSRDLSEVFGTSRRTIERWIKRGWLCTSSETERIGERQIRKFLKQHPEEYDLKRIDQAWFKGMLFPAFGQHAHGMGDNARHNPYEEMTA